MCTYRGVLSCTVSTRSEDKFLRGPSLAATLCARLQACSLTTDGYPYGIVSILEAVRLKIAITAIHCLTSELLCNNKFMNSTTHSSARSDNPQMSVRVGSPS